MAQELNIEQIKQHNANLKIHKERASKIDTEIEINTKELNRICNELTQELGVVVTPDNIEEVYNQRVEAIVNTLQSGEEVLRLIQEEANKISNDSNGAINGLGEVSNTIANTSTENNTGTIFSSL